MPDGTYLNEVFAPRIHKSNCERVALENEDFVRWCKNRIMCLASASPTEEALEMMPQTVNELVDNLIYAEWMLWAAEYIKENPKLCIDELEGNVTGEPRGANEENYERTEKH